MRWRTVDGGWNPYLAGALAGLLAVASAWATARFLGRPRYLGSSSTFVRAAGLIEKAFAPAHVEANPYFQKENIQVDWQFMLVLGIGLGALVSSLLDRSFRWEAVPPIWRERFGPHLGRRAISGLLGGIIAMIGVRLADGCPSGHGLSGVMQLSLSAFPALVLFFGIGVLVAAFLYTEQAP